jgi:folate-dependent phosphoribosylglycinamide formyltransferase PurN
MKIIMLAGEDISTNYLYNALNDDIKIDYLIREKRVSRYILIKRRIKTLGYLTVFGQILFKTIIYPYLVYSSKQYQLELIKKYNLNEKLIFANEITVDSVNSEETINILKEINPDIVIVNGTRIISKEILNSITGKFINIHVGITPLYRGVYGGYWALVQQDKEHCGVTIHLVDAGIDTGNILEQGLIHPTERDNFSTYQIHQLAVGKELIKKVVKNIINGNMETKPVPAGQSAIWSHPTIWEYLYYRIFYGVK